jgi:hypothetical protein
MKIIHIEVEKIEGKKDTTKNFIPDLAQEEWECENDFCRNINNYLTHYCLSNYNFSCLIRRLNITLIY